MQDHLHQWFAHQGEYNRLTVLNGEEKCKHIGCNFRIKDIRKACVEHDPRAFTPSFSQS